jgi:hypothetical protein
VKNAPEVTAGYPVVHLGRHFHDAEAGTERIDRQGGLDAESRRKGACALEHGAAHGPLPRERGNHAPPRRSPDAPTGQPDNQAHSRTLARHHRERSDRHVGLASEDRLKEQRRIAGGVLEVRVKKEQDLTASRGYACIQR